MMNLRKIAPTCASAAAAGLLAAVPSALAANPAADQPVQMQPADAPAAGSGGTNSAPAAGGSTPGFFSRFDAAVREQLATPAFAPAAPGAPAPERRGLATPFDSPPYPTGEWQIGGTTILGDHNTLPVWPLMEAVYGGPGGQAIKDSGIQMYGWVDFSGNLSSSRQAGVGPNGQFGNFPMIYAQRPNRMELDQAVVYLEKTPDEFQTDHVDWGFRIANVYGLDYRYMISRGYLDAQLLHHNNPYGFDMPMMYMDFYVPNVAQGMNIRVGRIISEADIEAQLAPNNPMSSHSLLYSFDPYTQWGVFSTIKLHDQWTVQGGIAAGNDVAPWQSDPGRQATGTVMLQYQSKDNKFSFYGGANSFNNGEFGYNNLQQFVGTLSYKFNDWVWTTWETWYMYQKHATTGPTDSVPFNNAFYPRTPGYAPEWATLNYTMFRLGPSTFLTLRNEIFDDIVGNRTGYNTQYTEHALGLTWWPTKLITVRPEIRFDHAYNQYAFDNGTRKSQFTAQFDVIVHF